MSESNTAGPPGIIPDVGDWATVHAQHPHITPETFAKVAVIPEPTPGITPPAASPAPPAPWSQTPMSQSTADGMAQALRSAGVPEDKIAAAMAADNVVSVPDPRSPAQVEYDKSMGYEREYTAADMKLPYDYWPSGMPAGERAEVQTTLGTMFASLKVTPQIATSLAEQMLSSGRAFQKMDEAAQRQYTYQQRAIALGKFNGDEARLTSALALVRDYLNLAPQSELRTRLTANLSAGAFTLLHTLATQRAEWLAHRPAK